MKPNLRRFILWLVLPVLLLALAMWSWRPHEPTWEGRTLGSWLKDLEPDIGKKLGGVGEQKTAAATIAIQAMGTNCLPFLLQRLGLSQPTPWERMLINLEEQFGKRGVKLAWGNTEMQLQLQALATMSAIEALGQQAAPAVPELHRWLNQTNGHKDALAAQSLGRIHPQGTSVLTTESTNRLIPNRDWVFFALSQAAVHHSEALAVLLRSADDADPHVRRFAGQYLCHHAREASVVLPVLIRLLADPDGSVRKITLASLNRFKGDLTAAVPALTTLEADLDPWTSSQAKSLLQKTKSQSSGSPAAALVTPP